jgi:thymidylate synthase (FAD)
MCNRKDRQSSLPCDDPDIAEVWINMQRQLMRQVKEIYGLAINAGIAKEVARVILPEGMTQSVLIMTGSVRSWIHYSEVRRAEETQKEHREIADLCWERVRQVCPIVCAAVEAEEGQRCET